MPGLGLAEFVDILGRLENPAIKVRLRQCTRLRHRLSVCSRCADACPVGAIQWDDGLTVDPEKCTSCGACATVCPTGALEAQTPGNAELVDRMRSVVQDTGAVVFACTRAFAGKPRDGAIAVNCLARLDESVLVGAVWAGAKAVWLVDGACADCPQGSCREVAEACAFRARSLLKTIGVQATVTLVSDLATEAEPERTRLDGEAMSRRGFFTFLARQTARVGAITADTVLSNHGLAPDKEPGLGELPIMVPEKRRLLVEALKKLGGIDGRYNGDGYLWNAFTFTESCTGCQMCTFFCPSGALTKWEQDGKVGIAFQISRCTACGLCRDSCYQNAVILSGDVDFGAVLSGTVVALPMRDADSAPWRTSGTERAAKSVLETLGLTNE